MEGAGPGAGMAHARPGLAVQRRLHSGYADSVNSLTDLETIPDGSSINEAPESPLIANQTRPGERPRHVTIQSPAAEYEPRRAPQKQEWDYRAIDPPEGYHPLDFKPFALWTSTLSMCIGFYIMSFALVLAVLIFDHFKPGMGISLTNTWTHRIYQYLPVLVSTVTSITWRAITVALTRMTEFLSMASVPANELNDFIESGENSVIGRLIFWRRAPTHHLNKDGKEVSYRTCGLRRIPRCYYTYKAIANPYGAGLRPILTMMGHGDLLLAMVSVMNLIAELFLVPLKSACIIVSKSSASPTRWTVKVSLGFGIALLVVYGLLIILAIFLAFAMHDAKTGLKWDPSSISDVLALTHGTNTMAIFRGYDIATQRDMIREASCALYANVTRRIGYWKTPDGKVWYGIAYVPVTDAIRTTRQPSEWHRGTGELSSKIQQAGSLRWNQKAWSYLLRKVRRNVNESIYQEYEMQPQGQDPEQNQIRHVYGKEELPKDWKGREVKRPEEVRYRDTYVLLLPWLMALYYICLVGSLTAGLWAYITGQVGSPFGFRVKVPHLNPQVHQRLVHYFAVNELGALFRFVPGLFMSVFLYLWVCTDIYFRTMQPFAGMYAPKPAPENLFLDYPGMLPIKITIIALSNCHFKVALFSFLSLLAPFGPIISNGLFTTTLVDDSRHLYEVEVQEANFWALFAMLLLYFISLPFAHPTKKRALPRRVLTLTDTLTYCHDTKLLKDDVLCAQGKTDTQAHLRARILLAKQQYMFGLTKDSTGRRCFAFDIAEFIDGSPEKASADSDSCSTCGQLAPSLSDYVPRAGASVNKIIGPAARTDEEVEANNFDVGNIDGVTPASMWNLTRWRKKHATVRMATADGLISNNQPRLGVFGLFKRSNQSTREQDLTQGFESRRGATSSLAPALEPIRRVSTLRI